MVGHATAFAARAEKVRRCAIRIIHLRWQQNQPAERKTEAYVPHGLQV
jgi:hypothetical protein